jgi:putative ABC transport system ATP-binding protein/lipoprotein-releasing system ATP-binding protein
LPHLVVEKVIKTFAVGESTLQAVNDISFEIERGEFVSITGHSGSGKTTLLAILGGISKPSSGRVLFDGMDIYSLGSNGLSEYRCEKIGFVFQFASLLPMLTAKENLLLPVGFHTRKLSVDKAEKKALELLGLVGLNDKADSYPAQLSGGQQRRVAIARAFMNEPEMILADEPTGDLDEETEADVMKFFMTMNEKNRTTFLMVTHNMDLAKQTKRQMKMHNGNIQEL